MGRFILERTPMRFPRQRNGRHWKCWRPTAWATCIQQDDGFTPTPVVSHAILRAQPRGRKNGLGGWHCRHAVAQSAAGWGFQIQLEERRPG